MMRVAGWFPVRGEHVAARIYVNEQNGARAYSALQLQRTGWYRRTVWVVLDSCNQRDHWPDEAGIGYLPANLLWLFLCFGTPDLALLYRREGRRVKRRVWRSNPHD